MVAVNKPAGTETEWVHKMDDTVCEGEVSEELPGTGICLDHDRIVIRREAHAAEEGVFEPIVADGVTYTLWTKDGAVGYKCTHEDGRVEYLYLNASGGSDDGVPTVFVYQGTEGDPGADDSYVHFVNFPEEE